MKRGLWTVAGARSADSAAGARAGGQDRGAVAWQRGHAHQDPGRQGDRDRSLAHQQSDDAAGIQEPRRPRQGRPHPRSRTRHGDHFEDAPALAKKNNAKMVAPAGLQSQAESRSASCPRSSPTGPTRERRRRRSAATSGSPQVHAEHDSELAYMNPETKQARARISAASRSATSSSSRTASRSITPAIRASSATSSSSPTCTSPISCSFRSAATSSMDPKQAAMVTREWLKPKYAIPIHYGHNPVMTGNAQQYVDAMGSSPTKVYPLKPGEKVEF